MQPQPKDQHLAHREFAQLLRLLDGLLVQVNHLLEEVEAPTTGELLRTIRHVTGSTAADKLGEVTAALEEVIRAINLCDSGIRNELQSDHGPLEIEGVANLPAPLARFIAERSESNGFQYEILQDEVRGWIIRWKEYTDQGTVRGHGQFYERPYAWLDD